jgi:hypothetical protein
MARVARLVVHLEQAGGIYPLQLTNLVAMGNHSVVRLIHCFPNRARPEKGKREHGAQCGRLIRAKLWLQPKTRTLVAGIVSGRQAECDRQRHVAISLATLTWQPGARSLEVNWWLE